jgi:SAM-dependent methyltransferase
MTAAATSSFSYSGDELDALAEAENYYRSILDAFAPHLGEHVVEVGAGTGTFASYLLRAPAVRRLTLIEPAENNFPVLKGRYAADGRVAVLKGYLDAFAPTLRADALVAVNVLEHVERDVDFLRDARRVLTPAGRLLLFVPATPAIFGTLDRAFEHYRRYTKELLTTRMRAAGFTVHSARYVNLPGVLSWFLAGRVLRKRTITRRDVRLYDRLVTPWVSWLDRRLEPPVGQSLVAVATP